MTESEEVAWINSLGFAVTLTDLRASYTRFTYKPMDPSTSVMWGTESDELRNMYRLYKRTNYPPFYDQAKSYRDYMVSVYSQWQAGGGNTVDASHFYLMGLVDWYVDHKDPETLAAINRLIDFQLQKVAASPFVETRVHARAIMGLAYYMEKIGARATEVRPRLLALVAAVNAVPLTKGLMASKYYVGVGWSVVGQPAGTDLRVLFPGNAAMGIVTGATTFNVKDFQCVSGFQDAMLMHALALASRVLGDSSLSTKAVGFANAWRPFITPPVFTTSATHDPQVPYVLIPGAPETKMFNYPSSSQPLYNTQFAAYTLDPALKKQLSRQALMRSYGQLTKVQDAEIGGKPRYYPWQTWESGYFLTQKN